MHKPEDLNGFDFQLFFDDSRELFAIFNRNGDFIRVNPSWQRTFGYSPEEMIGHNYIEFLHPDDIKSTTEKFQDLLKKDSDEGFVNRYRTKSGNYLFVEWKTRIVKNFQYCTARDVTARVNDREKLVESERLFRSLAETSPDMIMRFDRQYRHLYVNPASEKYLGIKPEKFIGKSHEELGFPIEQYTYWDERIEKVFITAEPHKEVASPDFGNIYFDWVLLPEFDECGKVSSVLSITRDITDLIKNKKALEESEEYHRRMFQEHDTVQLRIDTDGTIVDVNPAASSFYGYTADQLRSMHLRSILILTEDELKNYISTIISHEGKGTKLDFQHRLADGSVRDVEVHSSPINAKGKTL